MVEKSFAPGSPGPHLEKLCGGLCESLPKQVNKFEVVWHSRGANVNSNRKLSRRKTPSNHSRQHKRRKIGELKKSGFLCFVFWSSQNRKCTIYGAYSLITLNKLKPAFTNYCKFTRSRLVVSSKPIYGGYSWIILNKLNYQPLQITANL